MKQTIIILFIVSIFSSCSISNQSKDVEQVKNSIFLDRVYKGALKKITIKNTKNEEVFKNTFAGTP
jgi:hypothetical protein